MNCNHMRCTRQVDASNHCISCLLELLKSAPGTIYIEDAKGEMWMREYGEWLNKVLTVLESTK